MIGTREPYADHRRGHVLAIHLQHRVRQLDRDSNVRFDPLV
jgi:hypothetical protein